MRYSLSKWLALLKPAFASKVKRARPVLPRLVEITITPFAARAP